MTSNGSKFKIEDLYIGMEISDKNQLSNIYDTWILLVKGKNDDVYTVQFIGRETNAESDKLFAQGNVVCPVYNDSLVLEWDIYYEEWFYPTWTEPPEWNKGRCDFHGICLKKDFVKISYDRSGNILIGMDLLSQMDIHIGKSKILGKTVFLACPYASMNADYLRALNEFRPAGYILSTI